MVTQSAAGSGNDEWHQKTDQSLYQLFKIREGFKSYLSGDTSRKIKNLLFRRFFCLGIFYYFQQVTLIVEGVK